MQRAMKSKTKTKKERSERITWTFQPDPAVVSLVEKAIVDQFGREALKQRGLRTRLVNEGLTVAFAHLAGKRELAA